MSQHHPPFSNGGLITKRLKKGMDNNLCGLFGYSIKSTKKGLNYPRRIAMCAILQAMNDNRGGDSWGYLHVDKNGVFDIKKGIGDMVLESAKEVASHRTVLAHTRKATTGAISLPNCHPFEVENIIGAHNGMISNHEEMNKQYNRKCEVDSEQIFHHIAENKPLDELTGYGTISYINKKSPHRVFVCKVKNGSLSVRGVGKDVADSTAIVWSSDESHLEKALGAAGVPSFEYVIEEGILYFIEAGVLYKTEKKLEFKSRTYTNADYSSTGYGNNYRGGNGKFQDYEDDKEFIQYLRDRYGDDEESGPVEKPKNTIVASDGKVSGVIVTPKEEHKDNDEEVAIKLANEAKADNTPTIPNQTPSSLVKSDTFVQFAKVHDLGGGASNSNALVDPRLGIIPPTTTKTP